MRYSSSCHLIFILKYFPALDKIYVDHMNGPFHHTSLLCILQDMQKTFARYKTLMLSLNLGGRELQCETGPEVQQLKEDFCSMNRSWAEACVSLEEWEDNLRKSFMHCQVRGLNKRVCVNLLVKWNEVVWEYIKSILMFLICFQKVKCSHFAFLDLPPFKLMHSCSLVLYFLFSSTVLYIASSLNLR